MPHFFQSSGLRAERLSAIASQGYTTPTPIQAQAIPVIFEGSNLLAEAQTGERCEVCSQDCNTGKRCRQVFFQRAALPHGVEDMWLMAMEVIEAHFPKPVELLHMTNSPTRYFRQVSSELFESCCFYMNFSLRVVSKQSQPKSSTAQSPILHG